MVGGKRVALSCLILLLARRAESPQEEFVLSQQVGEGFLGAGALSEEFTGQLEWTRALAVVVPLDDVVEQA